MKKERGEQVEHSKVCFLSNFPPKECGIATFTEDLISSMNRKLNPRLKSRVIALNENTAIYNYDKRVVMQLNKDDIADYIDMAKKINQSEEIKLVCVQHEFGLFGGDYGVYLIPFLETLEKPAVVTFHSVLPNPTKERKRVVKFIADHCAAIIVMAETGINILHEDYEIEKEKIHVVYHGIPNVSFQTNEAHKRKLNLDGRTVLSTFGLLSRGKGIEYMIKALPALVKKYPNLLYVVIGETHPVVRQNEGEKYRTKLIQLVKKLDLQKHVKFYNKYLTLQEIIDYLLASDVYICTNLDENQIVSGTLSYAFGCGRAVVSTPSIYAKEILDKNKGVLAKFKDPKSFSRAIDDILSDDNLRKNLEKNSYAFGRSMTWQNVVSKYLSIFNSVVQLREETVEKFPSIKLNHLKKLTDDFGCIQFSKLSIPDKESGYTVDDNSRALIAATLHYNSFGTGPSIDLAEAYLRFLEKAQDEKGNFKNNFKNKEEILNPSSQDAFGRAIWSLGYAAHKHPNQKIKEKANELFKKSYKVIGRPTSLRSAAFSIMGLYHFNEWAYKRKNIKKINKLARTLIDSYHGESNKDWHWFEKELTYSNSKLPEALFLAYEATKDKDYLEVAEKTLKFLTSLVFINKILHPIGQNGWCNRNGERAFFDQQPVDASSLVQTYLVAYKITKKREYYKNAILAFNWFLGINHLKQMIYDETTGGCYDGLSQRDINLNEGAESTISYLTARLMLEDVKKKC